MGIYKSLGVFAVVILLASCNPGQAWKKHTIDNKEKSIMDAAKKGRIDTTGVKDLLAAYDAYVAAYPTESSDANYLFKEADFYRYMLTLKTTDQEGKNGVLVMDENDLLTEIDYDIYVLVES